MKKFQPTFAILATALMLITACGDGSTNNDKGAKYTPHNNTSGNNNQNGTPVVSDRLIYLYSPDIAYTGALGGSSGADGICKNNLPTDIASYEAHAMLNFGGSATVANMYSSQAIPNVAIYGYGTNIKIADNWADMLDGTIDVSLAAAGVFPAGTFYWTGFNQDGSTAQSNCTNYTVGTISQSSQFGSSDYTDGRWTGFQEDACSQHYQILCVAFTQPAI